MGIDPHRRSEARSIAYHRRIADRLGHEPDLLVAARQRIESWLILQPVPPYARDWQRVLEGDLSSIVAFLVDPGEKACELRQSSPFAGALTARERWRIWQATQDAPHLPP